MLSLNLAMLLLLATLPLVQLSTRYEMAAVFLVYGPMQLLRSIPYDIRVFILTHSRVSLSILHLTSQPEQHRTVRHSDRTHRPERSGKRDAVA